MTTPQTTGREPFSLRDIAVSAYGPTMLSSIGLGAAFPAIPLLARSLDASAAQAAFLMALIGIGSLIASVPASVLTSRIGEKWAMAGSGCVYAAALLSASMVRDTTTLSVVLLVSGACGVVFGLARQNYLTEAVPHHLRARALSTLGGVFRIGMFIGPLLGALVINQAGLRAAFVFAAGAELLAVALVLTMRELPGEQRATHSAGVPVRRIVVDHARTFATIGVMCALLMAVRGCRQVVIPLWAEHLGLPADSISLIVGLGGAMDTVVFYWGGLIMDRHGRRVAGVLACTIMAIALLALPHTGAAGWLLAVALLVGFGNGFGSGIVMTLGADYSPDLGRPQFLGIFRFLTDAGHAGGPVLLSWLTSLTTLAVGISSIGVLSLIAAGLFAVLLPSRAAHLENLQRLRHAEPAASPAGSPDPEP